jgi:hypothetical protein
VASALALVEGAGDAVELGATVATGCAAGSLAHASQNAASSIASGFMVPAS